MSTLFSQQRVKSNNISIPVKLLDTQYTDFIVKLTDGRCVQLIGRPLLLARRFLNETRDWAMQRNKSHRLPRPRCVLSAYYKDRRSTDLASIIVSISDLDVPISCITTPIPVTIAYTTQETSMSKCLVLFEHAGYGLRWFVANNFERFHNVFIGFNNNSAKEKELHEIVFGNNTDITLNVFDRPMDNTTLDQYDRIVYCGKTKYCK